MDFTSFEEFFPHYVGQHSKAATRWVHLVGTFTGAAAGLTLLSRRKLRGIPVGTAISYGAAWTSHFFIEKNKPATWGHPFWSFRGDMRMIRLMLAGRDGELSELGHTYKNTTPGASSPDPVMEHVRPTAGAPY
jgi:hypothetical protein